MPPKRGGWASASTSPRRRFVEARARLAEKSDGAAAGPASARLQGELQWTSKHGAGGRC
jgi:hypothetical protein